MANAWGLEPQQPDQAADVELGWTTGEDDAYWGPAQVRVQPQVRYGWLIAAAAGHKLRYWLLRSGVGRNTRRP